MPHRSGMLEDTAEDAAFRAEARNWLSAHAVARRGDGTDWSLGPRDTTPEAERDYFERGREWQRTLFDGGWAGITWPTRYGGRGGTAWQAIMFAEEMAHYDVTSGFIASTIGMVGPVLLAFGTDAQRDRFLRPLLRGDEAWCQLFSEPGAGSDLAALSTRAERHGDDFVVNGQKVWTSSAQNCDWAMLLTRSNPDAPKHKGITFLVVNMRTLGIEIRPLRQITGAEHFNEVFLTDVRVPVDNVIGTIDGGWAPTRTVLASEATMIGSATSGGDADALIRLARDTRAAGDARVRQTLAQVYIEERVLSYMTDRVLSSIRRGEQSRLHGSILKLFWSEARARKNDAAVDLLGPAGTLFGVDAPHQSFWQTQMLNRFWGTIGGGTSEVHRNMIGEAALGLPREPRVESR